jgi:UPF0716 protein FxsA
MILPLSPTFMRFFLIFTFILFPIMEIWLLIHLAEQYGWWLGLYLVLVTYLGWRLIQEEKQKMMSRMLESLTQGVMPNIAILMGFKNLLAGVLLVVPGIISDVIAVCLLLIPSGNQPSNSEKFKHTSNESQDSGSVFEGEFTREE